MSSLWVGNVSRKVTETDLKKVFKKYGECKVDLRVKSTFFSIDF